MGPSGAREVSDFSTGTVETASSRVGKELPAAGANWAGRPASGTTVEGNGAPSRADRCKVLPCWVIWSAASALCLRGGDLRRGLRRKSGDDIGRRQCLTRLNLHAGHFMRRRKRLVVRRGRPLGDGGPVDVARLLRRDARLGGLRRLLGRCGHDDRRRPLGPGEAAGPPVSAGPWPRLRAAWPRRPSRRWASPSPAVRPVRPPPTPNGVISACGALGTSTACTGRAMSRACTWAAGGTCSRMVVVTTFSKACSVSWSWSWSQR